MAFSWPFIRTLCRTLLLFLGYELLNAAGKSDILWATNIFYNKARERFSMNICSRGASNLSNLVS